MSTPFQNRLVGTIIVAAAAIIFLPDLLDGEKKAFQQQFDEIPAQPEIKINNEIKPFPDEQVKDLDAAEEIDEKASDNLLATANEGVDSSVNELTIKEAIAASSQQKEEIQTETVLNSNDAEKVIVAPAQPVLSTNTNEPIKQVEHGNAWVIQLGSFRSKQNVESLLAKLKLNDYVAFTRLINTRSGQMTKVYIGPEIDKALLEKQLDPLFNLTQVRGKISKFTPN